MFGGPARNIQFLCLLGVMLALAGCGGKLTFYEDIPLAQEVRLPADSTLLVVIPDLMKEAGGRDKEDIQWPTMGQPILLGEFCGLSEYIALAENDFSSLIELDEDMPLLLRVILKRLRLDSISVDNITLRAREGNFSFLDYLNLEIRSKTTNAPVLNIETEGNFNQEVILSPQKEFNLMKKLDELEGTDCLTTYLNLSGSIPSEDVVFDAILNIRIEIRLGIVI